LYYDLQNKVSFHLGAAHDCNFQFNGLFCMSLVQIMIETQDTEKDTIEIAGILDKLAELSFTRSLLKASNAEFWGKLAFYWF